jgi:hypothetical protein
LQQWIDVAKRTNRRVWLEPCDEGWALWGEDVNRQQYIIQKVSLGELDSLDRDFRDELYANTPWLNGRTTQAKGALEEEADYLKGVQGKIDGVSGELYDAARWERRQRVSLATAVDHGGFTVTDRRRESISAQSG